MNVLKIGAASLAAVAIFASPVSATESTDTTQAQTPVVCIETTEKGDVAHYDEGWHQIVAGDLKFGSDDVYTLPDGNFLQCFCPSEGTTGIQTFWRDVTSLDEETIAGLTADGWILVDNGPEWGLPAQKYLAKNSEFDCDKRGCAPVPTESPSPAPSESPIPSPSESPSPAPSESPSPSPSESPSQGGSSGGGGGGQGGVSEAPAPTTEQKQGEILGVKKLPETGNVAASLATLAQVLGLSVAGVGSVVYEKNKQRFA